MSDFEDKDLDDLLNEDGLEDLDDDLLNEEAEMANLEMLEDDGIDLDPDQIVLTEEFICSGRSICIEINPNTDTNFPYYPYFKVYNSPSYRTATAVARISMKEAKYIKDHAGKKTFALNNTQREELMELLSSIYLKDPKHKKTNWEKMIDVLDRGLMGKYNYKYSDLPMPDYSQLSTR